MRRSVPPLLIFCALAACSADPAANTVADVNAAAQAAQSDIDTYAANTLEPVPLPSPTASPVPTVTPTPVAEAATAPDSAQAAADVVRRYFALIAAKKYADAYPLWGEGGSASGMTQRQFATSFAKYASYHAEVGAPGEVDAGAGQRYVEVPVKVSGTLAADRRPFRLEGSVTLHRVGDVDGASAEERSWHIRDTALKPRPDQIGARIGAQIGAMPTDDCAAGVVRVSARDDSGRDALWRHGSADARGNAAGCTKTY